MAYNFSSAYISANVAVPTAYPFTMLVRGYSTSNTATQVAMALMVSSGDAYNGSLLLMDGAFSGDPARFSKFGGVLANSAGSYAINTWHALAGRAGSATALDVSLDGAQTAGASTSVSFKTLTELQIGARASPSYSLGMAGACACAAVYDVLLDDDELVSWAKGFSPRRIRPQSLKYYAPLVRALNLPVWTASSTPPTLSVATGTAVPSAHPRTYGM